MTPKEWAILYFVVSGLGMCVWVRRAEGKPVELGSYFFAFAFGWLLLPICGAIKLGSIKL